MVRDMNNSDLKSNEATASPRASLDEVGILSIKTAVSRLNSLILVNGINNAVNRAILLLVAAYGLLSRHSQSSLEGNLMEAPEVLSSTYLLVLLIILVGLFWSISKTSMERSINKIDNFILRNLSVDSASNGSQSWEKAVIELRSSSTSTVTNRRMTYLLSKEPVVLTSITSLILFAANLRALF